MTHKRELYLINQETFSRNTEAHDPSKARPSKPQSSKQLSQS